MGCFSWFSSDEHKRIVMDRTHHIVMTGADCRTFIQLVPYEGYGVFGGKDFYAYLAELNGVPAGNDGVTRQAGIEMIYKDNPSGDLTVVERRDRLVVPRLFTGWDTVKLV